MTADDQRFSLREAANLTDKSVDTLRRRVKSGKLPGAGADEADPTGTIFIPASALIAAGLLRPEQLAQGEPEEVLARRAYRSARASRCRPRRVADRRAALNRRLSARDGARRHGALCPVPGGGGARCTWLVDMIGT